MRAVAGRQSVWTTRLDSALKKHWADLEEAWSASELKASKGSIHKFRVATRRLTALLEIAESVSHSPLISKARRKLKKLRRQMGALRDLDVQIDLGKSGDTPGLSNSDAPEFLAYLRRLRRKQRAKVVKQLSRPGRKHLPEIIDDIRKAFGAHPATVNQATRAVDRIVTLRSTELQRLKDAYDKGDTAKLHSVRISARKLRFTLETAKVLLPDVDHPQAKDLHEFQTSTGNVRDRQLLKQNIEEWLKENRDGE